MRRVTVFYNGKVWYETDGQAEFAKYPVGAYVRRFRKSTNEVFWDRISERHYEGDASADSVPYDALPDWVKAWDLICR